MKPLNWQQNSTKYQIFEILKCCEVHVTQKSVLKTFVQIYRQFICEINLIYGYQTWIPIYRIIFYSGDDFIFDFTALLVQWSSFKHLCVTHHCEKTDWVINNHLIIISRVNLLKSESIFQVVIIILPVLHVVLNMPADI